MAQFDIHLIQNTSATVVEWQEKIVTPTANSILGFGNDSYAANVTMASGGGLALSSNTLKIDFSNITAETATASGDYIMFADVSESSVLRKITRANFLSGIADSYKVKATTNGTEDFLGADASTGVLRTSAPITYTLDSPGENFITLGVSDATTGAKGVVQIGTNISVSSGTISVATATTTVKGIASFSSTDFQVTSGAVSLATNVLRLVSPPATWNSSGTQYSIAIDSNYLYFAISGSDWRRTAGAKW